MSGREALEALERELDNMASALLAIPGYKGCSLLTIRHIASAVRSAALNAGPPTVRMMVGHLEITTAEIDRLRAWEKWGREQARPALEECPNVFQDVIAAIPKDSP